MIEIQVYSSTSRLTWFWAIKADRILTASSENGDGEYVGFATRESALADACKVATLMFSKKEN